METTPVKKEVVDGILDDLQIRDYSKATIREISAIAAQAEEETGVEFVKMEMGVPGLPPAKVGVDAEVSALQAGIASLYPNISGLPALKKEASRFVKAFIDIDLRPEGCIPVTGSMQGTFASFLLCSQCERQKNTVLFIDPGFPVQKQQLDVMGVKHEAFDIYDYRGEKLRDKLEGYLSQGNICAIIYSNPNNPSWMCLRDEELRIIGELATQYDAIVLEDLAYFAMQDSVLALSVSQTSCGAGDTASCNSGMAPPCSGRLLSIAYFMRFPQAQPILLNMQWRLC